MFLPQIKWIKMIYTLSFFCHELTRIKLVEIGVIRGKISQNQIILKNHFNLWQKINLQQKKHKKIPDFIQSEI